MLRDDRDNEDHVAVRKPAISSNDVAVGHGIVKKFAII